ncbi:MAG TPA: hypothetical protein VMU84_16965, partial [Thermoanaerobaculia bacterium]|nr:hypothetical protein [Thermoanaerobaculia bacterium]
KRQRLTSREVILFLQSMDAEQLMKFRNDLEISTYHVRDELMWLRRGAFALAAIHAGLSLLARDYASLVVPLLVVGLAYSAKEHESRAFAAILTLLGGALFFDFPRRLFGGAPTEKWISVPIGVTACGLYFLVAVTKLRNLKSWRSLIPLPPAEHLKD